MSWVYKQQTGKWVVGFVTGVSYVEPILRFQLGAETENQAQAMVSYLNGGKHPLTSKWEGVITPEQFHTLGDQRDMWEMLCRCGYSYLNDDSYEAVMDAVENFSFFDELVSAIEGFEPVFWTKIREAIALTPAPECVKPTMLDSDFDDPKE